MSNNNLEHLVLETDRLYMRVFKKEDAKSMFEMDSDPLVHKYLGNKPYTDIAQVYKYIDWVRSQYIQNGIGRFSAFLKGTNEFIGWSGLKIESEIRDYTYNDLGYRFLQIHWGKGYATETAKAWLKYGFNELKLEKIDAAADVDNIGSNKVLQKIGMKKTEQFMFEGELCNWYEMAKSEYQ
ncbi:MAG: GNAT family N-acetyltransferase [Bacteroidia bacterium]